MEAGWRYVVDMDLEKFAQRADYDILMVRMCFFAMEKIEDDPPKPDSP